MKERIVRRTKEQITEIKGKTDHAYIRNTSDREIERQVEDDPDSCIPAEKELEQFKPARGDID